MAGSLGALSKCGIGGGGGTLKTPPESTNDGDNSFGRGLTGAAADEALRTGGVTHIVLTFVHWGCCYGRFHPHSSRNEGIGRSREGQGCWKAGVG